MDTKTILGLAVGVLTLAVIIYFVRLMLLNKDQTKLFMKNSFNSISKNWASFTMVVISFVFMIAVVVGNTTSMSSFEDEFYNMQSVSSSYTTTVHVAEANTGDDPTEKNSMSDKFPFTPNVIQSITPITTTPSTDYFLEHFDSLNEINSWIQELKSNPSIPDFIYDLDVKMNFFIDPSDPSNGSIDGVEISNLTEGEDIADIQVVRVPDVSSDNYYEKNGEYYFINSPIEITEPLSEGENIIEDGKALMVTGAPEELGIKTGDSIQLYGQKNVGFTEKPTATVMPSNVGTYEIQQIVNPFEYITPSISNASSMSGRIDNDNSKDAIIFINESDFESLSSEVFKFDIRTGNLQSSQWKQDYTITFDLAFKSVLEDSRNGITYFDNSVFTTEYNNEISKSFSEEFEIVYSDGTVMDITSIYSDYNDNPLVFSWNDSNYKPNNNYLEPWTTKENYKQMSQFIAITVFLILLIVVSIITIRQIKRMIVQFGTLKAIGFDRRVVAMSGSMFMAFALLIAIPIGLGLSVAFSSVWTTLLTSNYLLLSTATPSVVGYLVSSIFMLFIIMYSYTYLIGRLQMHKPVLSLIKNETNDKANLMVRASDKVGITDGNMFMIGYSFKNMLRASGKSAFAFAIIGSMTVMLSFTLSANKMVETSIEKTFESVTFDTLDIYDGLEGSLEKEWMSNSEFDAVKEEYTLYSTEPDSSTTLKTWFESDVYPNIIKPISEYSYIPATQIDAFVNLVNQEAGVSSTDSPRNAKKKYETLAASYWTDESNIYYDEFLNLINFASDITTQANYDYILENEGGVSFGVNTYDSKTEIPAIEDTISLYNANHVLSPNKLTASLIADTSVLADFVYFDDHEGGNLVSWLSDNSDTGVPVEDADGNPTGEYYVYALVDSMTASSNNIQTGDKISIVLRDKYYPQELLDEAATLDASNDKDNNGIHDDMEIHIIVKEVAPVAIPFGIIIDSNSSEVADIYDGRGSINNYYAVLGRKGEAKSSTIPVSWQRTSDDIADGTNSLSTLSTSLTRSYFANIPISATMDLAAKNFAKIDQSISIVSVITISVAFILLFIIMSEIIKTSMKESIILKAQGYNPFKISMITLSGYLILFLLAFIVAAPVSFYFVGYLNGAMAVSNVATVAFALSLKQLLGILGVILLSYTILILFATYIYASVNPSKALKTN